jgi:predicted ArsR family transcriptional regulator
MYQLSDEVIKIQFPFRDYEMLAKIALDALFSFGEKGIDKLIETGRKFGKHLLKNRYPNKNFSLFSTEEKISILNELSQLLGLDPEFEIDEKNNTFTYKIYNCPFKEVAHKHNHSVCEMHRYFIKGMVEELFSETIIFEEESNILNNCQSCAYRVQIKS